MRFFNKKKMAELKRDNPEEWVEKKLEGNNHKIIIINLASTTGLMILEACKKVIPRWVYWSLLIGVPCVTAVIDYKIIKNNCDIIDEGDKALKIKGNLKDQSIPVDFEIESVEIKGC